MPGEGLGWFGWDEIEPFLLGLGFMGTGGGGSLAFGREIMLNDQARGRRYQVVSPAEVPDGALVVSGGIMGSVKALERFSVQEIVANWEKRFEPLVALRAMEEVLGQQVDFLVPFELGGLNTPVILSLGARAGIPVVDTPATLYIWFKAPEGFDDVSYARHLLQAGIVVTPGRMLAATEAGHGYMRLALVPDMGGCRQGVAAWRTLL